LDGLAAAAAKALAAEAAAVLLLEEARDHLIVVAGHCVPQAFLEQGAIPLGESPLNREVLTVGVATVEDAAADPRGTCIPAGFLAALCVSLGPAQQPSGVLHVYDSRPRKYDSAEIELLQTLADLGAAAIQAAHKLADLERIEASKSQFIRVTTHELRSPITVAQSLVRNVLKGYAGPITDRQQDVFARISGQLDFLESLANDLLDLAASKAPQLAAEEGPVLVNASVGRAILFFQPRAEEKGVALTLRPWREELVVWATEDGLDRIFVNLVGNAVKYTPSGGEVVVSLGQKEDEVQVMVADTGIGIPQEALTHLYEEFYRAPNARAVNAVGTGLGLAIVKELVDRYGGKIAVESALGKGTSFTVTFPLYRPTG
jgi:signal transduction histidine kinase